MDGAELSYTELLRENEALRERIEQLEQDHNWLLRFKLGIKRTDEIVFLTDPNGIIEFINPAFTEVYGYSWDEALGETPRLLKSGIYPQEFYANFWKTILAKKIVSGEIVNKTKGGDLVTMRSAANPILDHGNNLIGFLAIQRNITTEKQAEKALELSRAALEASMDGVAILNSHAKFSYVNEAFLEIYGYTAQKELEGKSWRVLYDQQKMEDIDRKVRPSFQKTGKWRGEAAGLKRDGTLFYQELSLSQIDNNGFICIVHDITKRKQAEKALRESEEKFRGIFENATAGIALIDNQDRIVQINQAYATMLGYSVSELVGKTVLGITHPQDPLENRRKQKQLMSGTLSSVQMEKLFQRRDGQVVCGLSSATLIRDDNGKPLYFLCHVVDITKRKDIEQALAESERDFRSMFENMQEGLYRVSPNGTILMANPSLAYMLGYDDYHELIGKNIYDLGAWDSAALDRYRKEMAQSGRITNFQHIQYNSSGQEIHVR